MGNSYSVWKYECFCEKLDRFDSWMNTKIMLIEREKRKQLNENKWIATMKQENIFHKKSILWTIHS